MSRSSTTIEDFILPSTVGEMLQEDFLEPLGMSPEELADKLRVTNATVRETISGARPIDAEMDLRLGRFFGISTGFFLGLQTDRELRLRKYELGQTLDEIVPRLARAA